ncbi:hypothetical protein B0T25DRAFT_538596 [Lasiosphaeria hispida]|uniref:Synaptobrevin n=1 Tax=Lasiosphaeria hispida TaxID=260671 RepID=A0AAJ0HLS1_9PEZI|nr:hypothetical protein B0T25DRAFT_538596 [Lasiosphaeria hispida]
MVRLIHGIAVSTPSTRHADPLTDLNRLLNRLQQTILRADAEREARLRASEFEREKVQTNIRYAQSLLTKLEQEAIAVKVHARRHEMQADLNRKREALDQLADRMSDLAEIAAAEADDDDDDDTSEGEDILADIIATPSESLDSSKSPDAPPDDPDEAVSPAAAPVTNMLETRQPPIKEEKEASPEREPQPSDLPPAATTSQTLRPRCPAADDPEKSTPAQTTGTSPSPSSLTLFGNRAATSNPHAPGATAATATQEAILDHQRAEQNLLSEAILKLAGDLKASSHAFSATLDEDKEVVDRAGQGMHRTGEGMEAVTRRMGMLQRMTEGEGWWGRMRLYAQVYGLMVVLVLVVFVLPKLRF